MAEATKTAPKPTTEADAIEAGKKKRQRSPSYPAINLEEAIERARVMFQHERRNAAALDAVVGHWGFGAKSSSGLLCAAAMKKFGLLVEVSGTKDRHVRLSEPALNIILDERPESPEREVLIREAALKPEAHKDLWEKYHAELPSDATIRTYLIRDKEFTDVAASQFIEEYKHTISFARLLSGDTIPNGNRGENGAHSGGQMTQNLSQNTQTLNPPLGGKVQPPTPPTGSRQDTFNLDEGAVTLVYPANLSEHSLEDFKSWVELAVRKIERSIKRKVDPAAKADAASN